MPESCKQVKMISLNARDGEYNLWYPRGSTYLKIYCHNMIGSPTEYLTLPAGEASNFIYKGKKNPSYTWVNYGMPCRGEFSKVRLLLTYPPKIVRNDTTFMTRKILQNNGTFTTASASVCWLFSYIQRGIRLFTIEGYGGAGDCLGSFSATGKFKIDLSGTLFRIPKTVLWKKNGYKTKIKDFMQLTDQIVSATCGGYCGGCNPASGRVHLPLELTGSYLYSYFYNVFLAVIALIPQIIVYLLAQYELSCNLIGSSDVYYQQRLLFLSVTLHSQDR